jgi:hypothetical protein
MQGSDLVRLLIITILIAITIAFAVFLNTSGSPVGIGNGTGTLTGYVTIDPLCPVEPCNVTRDQRSSAYTARPITISTKGGAVVTRVTADPVTGYTVALRPGAYVVNIPSTGVGGSRELPKTITITSGEREWLNITIDTGIRWLHSRFSGPTINKQARKISRNPR